MVLKKITVQNQVYDIVTRNGSVPGNKKNIRITNIHSTTDAVVYLYLEDAAGVKYHYLSEVTVAAKTSLTLNIIPFNKAGYHLRFKTTTASPTIDIILGNG